ncbi:MAG: hypothetical protein HQL87_10050 [Magnetococcales bacterium]|nr:hypothetical protein [Magnetococcales bacterium]
MSNPVAKKLKKNGHPKDKKHNAKKYAGDDARTKELIFPDPFNLGTQDLMRIPTGQGEKT